MASKLRLMYFCKSTPQELPDEETQDVAVIVPGEKWVLICNGARLHDGLLTYPYSQFVSGPTVARFERYNSVELDQEKVDLHNLKKMLKGMGFRLSSPRAIPASWR